MLITCLSFGAWQTFCSCVALLGYGKYKNATQNGLCNCGGVRACVHKVVLESTDQADNQQYEKMLDRANVKDDPKHSIPVLDYTY